MMPLQPSQLATLIDHLALNFKKIPQNNWGIYQVLQRLLSERVNRRAPTKLTESTVAAVKFLQSGKCANTFWAVAKLITCAGRFLIIVRTSFTVQPTTTCTSFQYIKVHFNPVHIFISLCFKSNRDLNRWH